MQKELRLVGIPGLWSNSRLTLEQTDKWRWHLLSLSNLVPTHSSCSSREKAARTQALCPYAVRTCHMHEHNAQNAAANQHRPGSEH